MQRYGAGEDCPKGRWRVKTTPWGGHRHRQKSSHFLLSSRYLWYQMILLFNLTLPCLPLEWISVFPHISFPVRHCKSWDLSWWIRHHFFFNELQNSRPCLHLHPLTWLSLVQEREMLALSRFPKIFRGTMTTLAFKTAQPPAPWPISISAAATWRTGSKKTGAWWGWFARGREHQQYQMQFLSLNLDFASLSKVHIVKAKEDSKKTQVLVTWRSLFESCLLPAVVFLITPTFLFSLTFISSLFMLPQSTEFLSHLSLSHENSPQRCSLLLPTPLRLILFFSMSFSCWH